MSNDNFMEPGFYPNEGAGVDLAEFDNAYKDSEVSERQYDSIPDGKYQVNVEQVELARAKTSGNPMLKWKLRILGPSCAGRYLFRNSVITQKTVGFLKTDLHTCGLDLSRLSELNQNLEKLLDLKLEVKKHTRGENENIYINRKLELDEIPQGNVTGPADDGEDIPF